MRWPGAASRSARADRLISLRSSPRIPGAWREIPGARRAILGARRGDPHACHGRSCPRSTPRTAGVSATSHAGRLGGRPEDGGAPPRGYEPSGLLRSGAPPAVQVRSSSVGSNLAAQERPRLGDRLAPARPCSSSRGSAYMSARRSAAQLTESVLSQGHRPDRARGARPSSTSPSSESALLQRALRGHGDLREDDLDGFARHADRRHRHPPRLELRLLRARGHGELAGEPEQRGGDPRPLPPPEGGEPRPHRLRPRARRAPAAADRAPPQRERAAPAPPITSRRARRCGRCVTGDVHLLRRSDRTRRPRGDLRVPHRGAECDGGTLEGSPNPAGHDGGPSKGPPNPPARSWSPHGGLRSAGHEPFPAGPRALRARVRVRRRVSPGRDAHRHRAPLARDGRASRGRGAPRAGRVGRARSRILVSRSFARSLPPEAPRAGAPMVPVGFTVGGIASSAGSARSRARTSGGSWARSLPRTTCSARCGGTIARRS